MFQGSRHVAKAEHIALVQAAGGTMNGSTWLDRTNYFETLPAHQLDLALWLEADRMATLLDALSQENLDNQREVVKNEKRWSYDNRPYGSFQEKLQGHLFPPEHPYHHSTIGSMDDLDAASLEDVSAFFRTYYAPNNAVLSVVGRRRDGRRPRRPPSATSGRSRRTRTSRAWATCRCRRRSAGSGARRSSTASRCRASTSASGRRSSAIRGSTRSTWPARSCRAARAAGSTGGWSATSGSPRTSRCSRSGSSAARSITAGWATVRPGVDVARVEAALIEELERLATELVSDDELARAKALTEADELGALQRVEERADRLSMYATLFDDPGLINRMLPRYLAVTPEAIRDVAAAVFRPDNRLVLTYLPEGSSADDVTLPRRGDDRRTRRWPHERHRRSAAATARSSPSGPSPGRRAPTSSRPSPVDRCQRPVDRSSSTCRAARSSRPRWSLTGGAVEEPADRGGATVLAARALTEGTERYDAIALIEAGERLGASLHAEAGWDALTVGVDVPADRLRPRSTWSPRSCSRPTFPRSEVERLRDERLNDLLQAQADPRRRVEEAFVGTIYAPTSPVSPPVGRDARDRRGPDRGRRCARPTSGACDPERATLVVGGDLGGQDVVGMAERLFGVVDGAATARDDAGGADRRHRAPRSAGSSGSIHRPGSVQTEIRIGHRGLPRRIADFHAVSVMSAILGGLFNSRLNMKLREEKGYTYGAGAGFDMRRGAGPFSARAAVNTEVTVPAIVDTLAELTRMRDAPVDAVRAGRRARLPDRRLPAALRDRRRRRRRARQPGGPRPGRRGAGRLPGEHRSRRHRRRRRGRASAPPRRRRLDRAGRRRRRVRTGPRGRRPRAGS